MFVRPAWPLAFFLCLIGLTALAQTFPALTGRVVDAARILKPEDVAALDAKLKTFEDQTSAQVVVATVPDLEGHAVEDYANRLFRQWKLGDQKANSGVLLLVAPKERKVRIEVGYGLEGTLTDALSSVVVTSAIVPKFKTGDFAGGIIAGTDGILGILNGDGADWQRHVKVRADEGFAFDWVTAIIVIIIVFNIARGFYREYRGVPSIGRSRRRNGGWIIPTGSAAGWSSGSSGWSGGGGFSGGGGSSGGGGASGSW
jgi:uncharacterized protein